MDLQNPVFGTTDEASISVKYICSASQIQYFLDSFEMIFLQ